MGILVYKDGQQLGPYDVATLKQGLAEGSFTPDDFAFYHGCEDWVPLSRFLPQTGPVPDLSDLKAAKPPPPDRETPPLPEDDSLEDPMLALSKLKQLHEADLISAHEYEAKRTEVLARL